MTFVSNSKLLPREDSDASELLYKQLLEDGCSFNLDAIISKVEMIKPPSGSDHPLLNVTISPLAEKAESK